MARKYEDRALTVSAVVLVISGTYLLYSTAPVDAHSTKELVALILSGFLCLAGAVLLWHMKNGRMGGLLDAKRNDAGLFKREMDWLTSCLEVEGAVTISAWERIKLTRIAAYVQMLEELDAQHNEKERSLNREVIELREICQRLRQKMNRESDDWQ